MHFHLTVAPYTSLAAFDSVRPSWSPTNSSSSESMLAVNSTPSLKPFATTLNNSNRIQQISTRSSFTGMGNPSITVIEVCETSLIGNMSAKSIWKEWKLISRSTQQTRDHDGKGDQSSQFKTLGVITKNNSWISGLTQNTIHYNRSYRQTQITTSSLLLHPTTSVYHLQQKNITTSRELPKVESEVITSAPVPTSKAFKYPPYMITCRNVTVYGTEARESYAQATSKEAGISSQSMRTTSAGLNETDNGHPPGTKGDTGASWRYVLLAGGLVTTVFLFVVVITLLILR